MADLFTGVAAPDVQTTKTSATAAPQFFTDYLSNIAQAGQTQLQKSPTDLVAPLSAMQTAGYAAVPEAAGAYRPGLTAAGQTAASAAGVNEADINRFMNPYTKNVVDEMARLSQQNLQRNVLPTMKAGFVGTGGLGSRRYGQALGQSMADIQSGLTGQQYGALSSGYKSAVDQALQEAQLENQAAQTQAAIAGKEQELGLTGAGAMTKAGAEQQAYEQSLRDAALKNATNVAGLLRSYNIPTTITENYKGPLSGVYSNSPLSQIAGLGTLLGSAFNTTTSAGGTTTNPWGTSFFNLLKSALPSSSTNTTTTSPNEEDVLDQIKRDELNAGG